MAALKESTGTCPSCGHTAEVIDRKTLYRLDQPKGTTAARQVPDSTTSTYRCVKDGCGRIFTRTVKH
jgi:hypothetical protein